MDETLFYACGAVVIASAILVVLLAVTSDRFPGRWMNLLVAWFVVFGVASVTFAIAGSRDESGAPEVASAELKENEQELPEPETGEKEGSSEQPKEPQVEPGEAGAGEAGGEGGSPEEGTVVFSENCSTCHGATGHGGNGGPDLRTMPLAQSEEGAIEQVTNGGGGMPAFAGTLSEEEIENVAAYVAQEITGGE
jgi:cytochrome c551